MKPVSIQLSGSASQATAMMFIFGRSRGFATAMAGLTLCHIGYVHVLHMRFASVHAEFVKCGVKLQGSLDHECAG
jgi:hypothetical protein